MEIYLTKMILNPFSRRVQFEVGNPQQIHKTICGAFQPIENQEYLPHHERITPRNKYDVLHRLEIDNRGGKAVLLVQSTAEPDWRHLTENFLAADVTENLAVKNVGGSYAQIENGMNLRFRLRANPTKRAGKSFQYADNEKREEFTRKFRDDKNRRRLSLNSDEERIEWLERKGTDAGFQLANVQIKEIGNAVAVGQAQISFSKNRNSPPLTFGSVIFDGVLRVTDTDKFRESLIKGIGTGKAYGFGLLSIAKSQNV